MVGKIDRNKIDTDRDGKISKQEWEAYWKKAKEQKDQAQRLQPQGSEFKGMRAQVTSNMHAAEMASAADAHSPSDTNLATIEGQMNALLAQIEQAKGDNVKLQQLQQQLQRYIAEAEQLNKGAQKTLDLSPYKAMAGTDKKGKPLNLKAQSFAGGNGRATQANAASAQARALGLQSAPANNFAPPSGWGAKAQGIPNPDPNSLLQSALVKEEYINKAWDEVNKNTKRGKQLMMLFFYYAKLAESGDMGAIYQFMKFITYIISKDKAKQQIEMGKKLIQLQELSRKWTNKLLEVQTNATDSSASSELMKTMTIVKSETDAIATSQKLISQMMEEFAQVVETLTNTTKGALETQGRILRTVSTFR